MKQRIFSGIQPSGNLHIGNYLGAIKQWLPLQDEYDALFCVVDLHAITVPQDPIELRKKTLEIAKIYLAAGIDPEKCILFAQSHVKEHTELAWVLNTITKNADLSKMTQFKDKSGLSFDEFEKFLDRIGGEVFINKLVKEATDDNIEGIFTNKDLAEKITVAHAIEQFFKTGLKTGFDRGVNNAKKYFLKTKESFNSVAFGLYDYPVLMAADILLYDTAVVPVGKDQAQHVELTRTLAERFNKRFGETFVVPEVKLSKEGQIIMGLDDPSKKMSKSASSEYNYISLTDDATTVEKKIKKAVTDSGSEIVYSDDKPALKNLINIYTLFSDKTQEEVVAMYQGKGYGDFKAGLTEVIVHFLSPFQERFASISDEEVEGVLRKGAEKARTIAKEKMRQVNERVGFLSAE